MEETKVVSNSSETETSKKETSKKESSKKETSKKKAAEKEGFFSKIGGFFTGVTAEFNKIMWTSREDVVKQTTAVVVVSAISCALIALLDIAFEYGVDKLVHLFNS
ncbi:preprotein translocase subunit SecE [Butyrivibrio proteoclasticus]|uniref:preprotein translocase subunit SecE n=1 Tax=Butyrivibrio proteoclasticus TaxID=43305 RepID=UPI0009DE2DBA|nr:preprotein translocase subunit SecE [Butyrivibrio proteoclasticus]